MKKVFAVDETNAPRMLYILRNVLLALVEQPQATLLDVPRMLGRRSLPPPGRQPRQRSARADRSGRTSLPAGTIATASRPSPPIQNKVGQFLTSPLIRHVFRVTEKRARPPARDGQRQDSARELEPRPAGRGQRGACSAHCSSRRSSRPPRAGPIFRKRSGGTFILYADEFQTYAGTESLADHSVAGPQVSA